MATNQRIGIGNVVSVTKRDDGLELQCDAGRVRVTVLSDGIVRVRATQATDFGADFSYAIAKTKWPKVKWECRRDGGEYTVRTKQAVVRIATTPLRIQWERPDGTVLNGDCGIEWEGAKCRWNRALAAEEMFFGCGEKTGQLNKRGEVFANWNTDNPQHTYLNGEVYVSIPFLISVRRVGEAAGRARKGAPTTACYGLFFDNSHRTLFNLGRVADEQHYFLEADAGEVDAYFFAGDSVRDIVRGYTELTGRMWLPPKWALGFQQCRWSYMSADEMLEVATKMRAEKIPCDVLYCDIDYMDGYRVFTWNPKTFPKPKEFIQKLQKLGFRLVTIIDPGVKNDDQYVVCQAGKEQGMFLKKPDGQWFTGNVWPGECVFPDFTSPRVRQWWGQWHKEFLDLGVAGFWNDMNEPAVWNHPGGTMPLDIPHEFEGHWQPHKRAHNVYGFNMARACYEGLRQLRPAERPFVITRSAYAGVQRYSMVWTGDNHSAWEQLDLSIRQCLNLSLSGVAFCGPDVGGFSWDATGELLARWTQAGAFFPFFRNHTHWGSRAQEPYAFTPEITAICRDAIRRRYALLPYLYNLFHEATVDGSPIIRPLFWEFPDDAHGYAVDDQFLLGPAILVAPILKRGQRQRAVYLPAGADWYEYQTTTKHTGGQFVTAAAPLEKIPVFVRAGSILPTCEPLEHTGQKPVREIILDVYPGAKTTGYLYEDDGQSFAYESGQYSLTKFTWADGELRVERKRTGFESPVTKFRVRA